VIVDADTIINPRAVMVETFDAAVADRAVATATCSDGEAVGAQLCRVDGVK